MSPVTRRTAVQFGIRAIFGSTAAIAMFFAATAPVLRGWGEVEREAFLAVWAAAFLTTIGIVAGFCVLRVRAERRAGPVCLMLSQFKDRRRYLAAVLICLMMVGLLAVTALFQRRQAQLFEEMHTAGGPIPFSPLWSVFSGISFGLPMAISATTLWWRTFRIELCERGIIYFVSFVPWSSINYVLDEDSKLLSLRLVTNRFSTQLKAVVPVKVQEHVRGILRRYAAA